MTTLADSTASVCESLLFRLPHARDLTTMLAERELLEQIRNVFSGRHEAHLDLTVRAYRSDATEQAQRIGDAIAQVDLEHALVAQRRER